ncbi:chromatin assembly factor 1 subunit FAS1 isoform X3 [Sesamum indicum]|uniref:Chromatin assembly factor 1 subunit FAS1 isoform X3 n=1 Tax=Sesamum indicum TaxID=4182 RepID=A0A6I9T153_SESIN|nr:chromatin assembly factor 1 subunit FAS1 isoform X3 [Sesamum indicum]
MTEVEPMKIDIGDETKPKISDPDQKKQPLKRKRLGPSLCKASPEEKQAKIDSLRNEISSLVRFCKELVLENRRALLENVEKVGNSSASLNCMIACLMEESDLPLFKLVDEIFEKVKGRTGNGESVTKASVKSTVLMIGQRLCYGVASAEADLLEDEAECALWCWEVRDLKLMPKLVRGPLKVRRTCRKKIQERIKAVLAMINALEKLEDHQTGLQEVRKASAKLDKVLNEANIRDGKEVKKEEKLLIKEMEKNKRELEKERKKMDRELQKEKLQSERELKRLHSEVEREERRREKEEYEMQKQLKRQQEEAEKDLKRKEKEEAELKEQLALQKQASLMERFLKKNKTTTFPHDNFLNKAPAFVSYSNMVERKSESVTIEMDTVLAQNVGVEAEDIWKSHLTSWRRIGNSIRSNRKVHWGTRQKPKTELVKELKLTANREPTFDDELVVEKLVDGWVDNNVDGRLSGVKVDRPLSNCQEQPRIKQLLQFDKSYRPAFYGVWPRKSQVVKARHPFAKDPNIDYEIDSDEEWEEDEPGESLSDCDKDDEDGITEGHLKGDDEDESEDGFFVPDGYLSENEGVQADEMESDELVEEVRNLPDSQKQIPSEEFCTLLRQQKYLNSLTEHALKKNQPLIISNLMHEKTTLSPAEELTGTEKLERLCLQTLSICPLPDIPSIEISVKNDVIDDDVESSSNKSSPTLLATAAAMLDCNLPQIISVIRSCPHSIGKIVETLHNKFPAISKSQLRSKVREISDFSESGWQVKKGILSKLGLSISPEKKCTKAKSIITFFSKRCLPPSGKTVDLSDTSPQPSRKHASIVHPQQDCTQEH